MIRRWSSMMMPPLVVLLVLYIGTTAITTTTTLAFTSIPPPSSSSSFYNQQRQQETPIRHTVSSSSSSDPITTTTTTSTALDAFGTAAAMSASSNNMMMTPWNMNPEFGAPPFGFDMNAEIWNGRIAQVSFVWVFVQEFVQRKGVLQGLNDGDMINVISLSVFAVTIVALIGRFLAEPPAGWPTRELSESSPQRTPIRSNPMAYVQAKSMETLTRSPSSNNNDKTILNFNDGTSPFGFKKNAEIWNSRIAMISFVWVIVQEFFQGEGAISAMQRSDGIAMTSFWCAMTAMLGFTGVLSSMEEDDGYVERVVGMDALRQNAKDPGWKPPMEAAYQPIRVTSVAPGTGVSEPITYERYMMERARMVKDDFASSLKSMSAEPRLVANTQATTSWTTNNGKPMASWDTSSTTESSYWMTSTGKPMSSWGGKPMNSSSDTQPYGTAYTPVAVKAGTSVAIEGTNLQQVATVKPIMSYAETLKAMTSDTNDKSKMSLPYGTAYMPVVVRPGTLAEVASPGASRHLNQYDSTTAFFSATTTVVPNKVSKNDKSPHPDGVFEFKSSMKRAIFDQEGKPITYVVEGYRFKPETKSLIHPDGVFKFESETRKIIKLNERDVSKSQQPKAKPISYSVAGFRFDDNTKTVIQKEKIRGSALASPPASVTMATKSTPPVPEQSEAAGPASIVAPSTTNVVSVISDGASMNSPPIGAAVSNAYKAMGSSYLEALNDGQARSPIQSFAGRGRQASSSDDDLIVKPVASSARAGLSYLETLGR